MSETFQNLPRNTPGERIIPLKDWPKYHDDPPIGGLRWLVYNAKHNGFEGVILRRGKRISIDEKLYFKWLRDQN